jgi:DNA-binding MarR family transcriptional regulator
MAPKGARDSIRPLTIVGLARVVELSVRATGLTASQYRAMGAIGVGVRSGAQLARFLDVRPSSVTTVLDGLESEGWVTRTPHAHDRRRVDLALTARGVRALGEANVLANRALIELMRGMGADARAVAFDGLDAWQSAIGERRRTHWGSAASAATALEHAE